MKPSHPRAIERLRRALAADRALTYRPPPKLTVSTWADEHRYLSRESSAEPGKWYTARAPYLRGIMDAIGEPGVETVVVMSAAQIGKTETINNVIGYYADFDPAPMLVVQPTLDMAQAWSKDRLAPMIRDTPRLRLLFPPAKTRSSDNAILHKTFPGGHLTVVGANSASGLAARPIRIVLADEVDRYPASAGSEGDPVALATKRTATFWNRTIVLTSTPTVKGFSRIEAAFAESDQRQYEVPCPACAAYQVLRWANVRWSEPADAHLVCADCGAVIEEPHKLRMLERGRWVATATAARMGVVGFHVNALYSPWARWADLVRDFLAAKGSPERLRVFVNTVLAETWEDDAERIAPEGLLARRETYEAEVPAGVGVITAGVDVQADRIEILLRGWGAGEESWMLRHEIVRGDPSRDEVWRDVERVLTARYGELPIGATCIDSGYATEHVYRFVAPRQNRRVFATKGTSQPGRPLVGRPSKANRHGVKLMPIGADTAKDVLYARLKIPAPAPGYLHFPMWADEEYFAQLTAEQVVTRYVKGRPVRTYEKIRPRNEALDLEVQALCALAILGAPVIRGLGPRAAARVPPEPAPDAPAPTPAELATRRRVRPARPGGNWVTRW